MCFSKKRTLDRAREQDIGFGAKWNEGNWKSDLICGPKHMNGAFQICGSIRIWIYSQRMFFCTRKGVIWKGSTEVRSPVRKGGNPILHNLRACGLLSGRKMTALQSAEFLTRPSIFKLGSSRVERHNFKAEWERGLRSRKI